MAGMISRMGTLATAAARMAVAWDAPAELEIPAISEAQIGERRAHCPTVSKSLRLRTKHRHIEDHPLVSTR
jgi:hypothetical protein